MIETDLMDNVCARIFFSLFFCVWFVFFFFSVVLSTDLEMDTHHFSKAYDIVRFSLVCIDPLTSYKLHQDKKKSSGASHSPGVLLLSPWWTFS